MFNRAANNAVANHVEDGAAERAGVATKYRHVQQQQHDSDGEAERSDDDDEERQPVTRRRVTLLTVLQTMPL